MNIGIVTTWFERGAAYVSKAYLATLSDKHNVYIYARGGEKYGINDPNWDFPYVTWGQLPHIPRINYIEWEDFKNWIDKNQIEILLFNEQISWDVILKCQALNILLGTYIDYYTKDTISFFGLFDFLLCNTKRHLSVFSWHPQAIYIPWGTNIEICQPMITKIERKKPIIFFHSAGFGGVKFRKGTDILVKAFRHVKGNVRLVIHSQANIDRYGDIKELILNDERIEFLEKTVPLPGLYHLGNVYVYPSRLEGIGLTVMEAMACGLPVISTDTPPINEFVIDGFNGKLVPVEKQIPRRDNYYWDQSICSEEKLTESMQYYVDNISILETQSTNASNFAMEKLDWKKNSIHLPYLFTRIQPKRNFDRSLHTLVRRYENREISRSLIKEAEIFWTRNQKVKCIKIILKALLFSPSILITNVVGPLLIKKKLININ